MKVLRAAEPSVVLPLHAGLFISYCFSTKLSISGGSIKTVYPNSTKIKPQAQPGIFTIKENSVANGPLARWNMDMQMTPNQ
jgi:hypothetical protein